MSTEVNPDNFSLNHAHSKDLNDVKEHLNADFIQGLSAHESNHRLDRVGENRIITPSPSIWEVYLAPLFDTLITVYLIITGVMVFLALIVDGLLSKVAFWLVMIAFNFVMAIFQQYRAQKKVQALASLSPPQSRVIRNGVVEEIPAKNLVPGDLIDLALGDRIPADARLITSSNLTVNEASLTGESVAVRKNTDPEQGIDHDTPIAKHTNMVYLGTFVQTGSGKALVVKTGNRTELGMIATEMSGMASVEIPLRSKVNTLGKGLSALMLTFLVILVTTTAIRRANSDDQFTFTLFAEDIAQAIINAMSVLPINIPLLTTVVLITGVLNMATKKVVIKELSAVETLGRCSVLCSDKTGTITTGKMTVKMLWNTHDFFQVWPQRDFTNKIYKIKSQNILDNVDKLPEKYEAINSIDNDSALELLITCAVLNNDANLSPIETDEGIEYKILGNFTDGALLILARTNGLDKGYIEKRYQQKASYPFDSSLKRMSGLYRDTEEGDVMIFSKGASEVIIPKCSRIGDESEIQPLEESRKEELLDEIQQFTDQGYRVISMAYKPAEHFEHSSGNEEERDRAESDLIYIGFAVIYDPPRPLVYEAVADLDSAGIFPIMITGDSMSTAATIARQVGILDPDELVVEGSQAANLPDDEFYKVSVFARVAPKDKEVIVNRYQKRGDVVAMTGDGVNDALAITRSDAGVAMGISGTEVAKEAADIILTDDSYVSLVEGVREGRNLYNKIRMMIFFYIAVNLAEAIMYFTTSFRLDFSLLNNWQRAYIFGIGHAIPVLAIIFGPDDQQVMTLKPRQNDALLTRKLIVLASIFAVSSGLLFIISYFVFYGNSGLVSSFNQQGIAQYLEFRPIEGGDLTQRNLPEDLAHAKARTMLLTIIYLLECLFIFSIIRVNRPIWEVFEEMNGFVYAMIFSPLLFHFSIMYITPLQLMLFNSGVGFDLIPLNFIDLLVCFIIFAIPMALMEAYKYHVRENLSGQF